MKLYSPLWLLSAITFGLANQNLGQVYSFYVPEFNSYDTWTPVFTSNGLPPPSLIYPTVVPLGESDFTYSWASFTYTESGVTLFPSRVVQDNHIRYDTLKFKVVYDGTIIHPNHWELFPTEYTIIYEPDMNGVSLQTGAPAKAIRTIFYVSKYEEREITNWRTIYSHLEPIPEPEGYAAVFGASVVGMAIFLRRRRRTL